MKTFKSIIATLLAIQALSMAAAGFASDDPPEFAAFDFTYTLDPWTAGASSGCSVTKETLQLNEDPQTGPLPANRFAALYTDGCRTVWMIANLTVTGKSFDVTFDARNIGGCEGCIPLVYAGRTPPKYAAQFATDYVSLGDTWQTHKLRVSGLEDDQGKGERKNVYIAIGFVNLDQERPDLPQTVGVDNIAVTGRAPAQANSIAAPGKDPPPVRCIACKPDDRHDSVVAPGKPPTPVICLACEPTD